MNILQRLFRFDHDLTTYKVQFARELMTSLLSMAWFVEARDPYTGGHLWRVSRYSRLLAEVAGLDETETARVSLGGFLHDLGKVGVPDAILRKTGPLTDEEYDVIKTHPDLGLRMLANHPLASLVKDAVGLHHERPDGKGYPFGLTNLEIPLDARIVGISDAFDAMTSHRPYRQGMHLNKALDNLERGAWQQFDAILVKQFVALGFAGKLNHIMGHSDENIPLDTCPMCGPTLVIQRTHQEGQHIFCRNCSGGFTLVKKEEQLRADPFGFKGSAADLEPSLDTDLILRLLESTIEHLPINDLFSDSQPTPGILLND